MWWDGSKPHEVYLGTRAFAVCCGSEKPVVQEAAGVEPALAALSGWLAEAQPRRRLRVWLSGGLCRPFMLPLVPGVSNEEELQRVAAAMAPAESGLQGPCKVWLSPRGKQGDARIAVALQEQTLQHVLEAVGAAGRKHRLLSIRPWWAEVLRQALLREPKLPVLAVQDCDALTVLNGGNEGFDGATTLSPVFDDSTADAALARMLLNVDAAPGQEMRVRLSLQRTEPATDPMALAALAEWSR